MKNNTMIAALLLVCSAQAAEVKKPELKIVNKIEVAPEQTVTSKKYDFNMPEKKTIQFQVQKLSTPEASTRGWTSAYAATLNKKGQTIPAVTDAKVVVLPVRLESQALKHNNLSAVVLAEEPKVETKQIKVLSEKEERMLGAKILAQKKKCFISIGLWKGLGRDEEALTCLVHDQYDDVAMMNLKNSKSDEGNELLSRASSFQLKSIDESLIKNSDSLKAKILMAFENGQYKEVVDKASKLEINQANFKILVLKALSLSSLQKNEDALEYLTDLEKVAPAAELTVLNVMKARLYLKLQKPNEAMLALQQMPKDHPLWLESMQDLGWAQLHAQDFSGAIGNMYSLHTPYFRYVYQPQSYVVRTIGYLNLCQYGDAYRTLTEVEQKAQAWTAAMQKPTALSPLVKSFVQSENSSKSWQLPSEILRELARNRGFINLQKEINRLVKTQADFKNIEAKLTKLFKESQERAATNQKELKKLVNDIKTANKLKHMAEVQRLERLYVFQQESYYARMFEYQLAKNSLEGFRSYLPEVDKKYSQLYASYEGQIEALLQKRFKEITKELAQIVDQNEMLRYEVFAGSGEDIRYQAAGGVVDGRSGRLPASYKPSKSMQWNFDGEIWEDEIGHYRSSLINNCPKTEKTALDGVKASETQGGEDDKS